MKILTIVLLSMVSIFTGVGLYTLLNQEKTIKVMNRRVANLPSYCKEYQFDIEPANGDISKPELAIIIYDGNRVVDTMYTDGYSRLDSIMWKDNE